MAIRKLGSVLVLPFLITFVLVDGFGGVYGQKGLLWQAERRHEHVHERRSSLEAQQTQNLLVNQFRDQGPVSQILHGMERSVWLDHRPAHSRSQWIFDRLLAILVVIIMTLGSLVTIHKRRVDGVFQKHDIQRRRSVRYDHSPSVTGHSGEVVAI